MMALGRVVRGEPKARLEGCVTSCRGTGERGAQTLEWIGLSAVILTLLLGMFSMMPAGGQAIGSQMHATISTWVEVWSGGGAAAAGLGGGTFASGGPYSTSLPGQTRGGVPRFGQSGHSVGPAGAVTGVGLVEPTNNQQSSVPGAADRGPWWRRALGGLWGMIISPFRPAGASATTAAGSGTADPGDQFVDAMQEGFGKAVGVAERYSLVKHLMALSSQGTLAQPSPLGVILGTTKASQGAAEFSEGRRNGDIGQQLHGIKVFSGAALQMVGILAPFDPYTKMAIWGIGFAVSNYDEPPATLLPR